MGPPAWPRPSPAVAAALAAAADDGSWGRYHGPHGQRLREDLAAMHGVRHAWLCSSGTIAVELALRGLKIGPGDEVILAGYDFPGNFRAIEAIGARPVLVDLAPGTWTVDVEQVERAIEPQTKAILASHLHGSLASMAELREVADRRELSIVEDACQMPGALMDGQPAGSIGDCGVHSFGGSKLLTAGRGGAVLTDRDDVLQRIKVFAERGNDAFPLSELQAAVLVPQLGELKAANAMRLKNVRLLLAALADVTGLELLTLAEDDRNLPAFYKLAFRLSGECSAADGNQLAALRQRFAAAVRAEGVALDEGFRGFVRRSAGRCRTVGDLPHASLAAAATVILHHPVLLEPESTIARVAQAIRKVAGGLLD